MNVDQGLQAHWPLVTDAHDVLGRYPGDTRGVVFRDGAAWFDGRNSVVEVPNSQEILGGSREFSIAGWLHTAPTLDHVLGDIVSKFDPSSRRGINFTLMNFAGVTSSQANHRNLFFGIDAGTAPSEWRDCGRPGNSIMVWALCVHQGDLYAGTFETGKTEAGHVYRYAGEAQWVDCGAPAACNAVTSLAVHEGHLYAAASHYRSSGSSIAESENETPGGEVFRYEGGTQWASCGVLPNPEAIFGLTVYRGQLYASSMYKPAGVYRYEGGQNWQPCGQLSGRIAAMTVHRGYLYGSGYDVEHAGVYRYGGGDEWVDCGTPAGVTQTYSFAQHHGEMYVGTWPGGRVFRYDGEMGWEDTGRLGQEEEVMAMAVYNGKLYGGTLPLAEVYRYDGDGSWTRTGQLDTTPDVRYRRAWSMAVYQGKLFCGTLPAGRVYSMEAGCCVTHDHAIAPGWCHIAAVRGKGQLALYVGGKQAATSRMIEDGVLDVSNEQPLRIGFGTHDYFNGGMRDLRIYGRLLDSDEILALSKMK
ncbi:MAG: hypothetical protein IT365_21100 [Candidatus Hydrogenedentes bacterium]|nr:hypothetical protein [Candidatus Hydrogenedentota bacterium]